MSLAVIYSRAIIGVQAPSVTVEVHISNGLPGLTLVGLPETTVKEARDRVRSALINNGFTFPARRITVNLAPADLPKEGGRYDLPIALAILAASEQLPLAPLARYEFLGELALSGALRAVRGAIPAALAAADAGRQLILGGQRRRGRPDRTVALPYRPAPAGSLRLSARRGELPVAATPPSADTACDSADLRDIIGQEQAKRALEIAAAGGHNLLLIGPPGTGKTMLASRLTGLLPPLTEHEALESRRSPACSTISPPPCHGARGRFAHRITVHRWRHWSAAAHCPAPVRSLWRITACCFWMSYRNSSVRYSMRYVNRWNPARS